MDVCDIWNETTERMRDWEPVKYDPDTAGRFDEGTYYDGYEIFSIYTMDDEEVDDENGYIGCLVCVYPLDDVGPDSALWTGYKSTNECMEHEWHTDNVWRITTRAYDSGTFAEMSFWMYCDGIDLSLAMERINREIEKG